MNTESLESRVRRLEDIESIRQLKARYCQICDDDHNPELITSVFAEDAIWEGRGIGRAEGHAGIRDLFRGFQAMISFSQHMVMNPVIDGFAFSSCSLTMARPCFHVAIST